MIMQARILLLATLVLVGCSAGDGDDAQDPLIRLDDMARAALSQIDGEISVPGLQGEVEVIRDAAGIAHIYAGNTEDLFFAQGFVAAQDRLWEMDVWRRYAEGRASEIVGPERVHTDRLYRLMKYRGSRGADLDSYHPEAERIFAAFAAGVNAYVSHQGDNLPVEFKITGTRPDLWTADLSALRLVQRAASRARAEVQLAKDVVEMGAEAANRASTPDPYVPLTVPDGLDIEAIAEHADAITDALRGDFDQILRPPVLPEYQLSGAVSQGGVAARFSLGGLLELPMGDLPRAFREEPGSNNWVLSPRMTTT
ncbi:MAG: penicillin acylase family protein, partial [Gemmatimonadota bacterium]|nr:penicillin acylase family protein [Gemmatimonadota bacterium]